MSKFSYIIIDHAFYSDITKNGLNSARLIVNEGACRDLTFLSFLLTIPFTFSFSRVRVIIFFSRQIIHRLMYTSEFYYFKTTFFFFLS